MAVASRTVSEEMRVGTEGEIEGAARVILMRDFF